MQKKKITEFNLLCNPPFMKRAHISQSRKILFSIRKKPEDRNDLTRKVEKGEGGEIQPK